MSNYNRNYLLNVAVAVVLSLSSLWVSAKTAEVDEIYQLSGLKNMVERFPEMLKEGIQANVPDQSDGDAFVAELSGIIDGALKASDMEAGIKKRLQTGLDKEDLTAVKAWLTSPVGEKVVTLEKASMSADSTQRMEASAMQLQQKYKGSEREKLFHIFDKATQMTESSLETAMAVQVALAGAFAGEEGGAPALSYEQLQQMVEANRFMTRGLIGQQVFTSYLYTYESLSLTEIREYVGFAQSPEGSRYFNVLNEALKEVLIGPSKLIGQSIMRAAMEKN